MSVLLHPSLLLALTSLGGLIIAAGLLLPGARPSGTQPSGSLAMRLGGLGRLSRGVASRGWVSGLVVVLLAFASGAANGLLRLPVPSVNDEFGYLLIADTFAHGRLANPTPLLERHFETIGVSMEPVYVGKYPPIAALFLALGQVVFGHPFWGHLLAYALAAGAVAFMLRAWVGPRWGLVGGILVALHPTMQHFQRYDYSFSNYSWSHSYWGGAVAMLGGALVFGGLRRFLRRPRKVDAALLTAGLVVLANSRPFEGFLIFWPVVTVLLFRAFRGPMPAGTFLRRLLLPAFALGLPALAAMALYNQATTGDALRLTHQHYADQYGVAAELLLLPPRTPPSGYGNREMERFYLEWVRPVFLVQRSDLDAYLAFKVIAVKRFFEFFFAHAWPALFGAVLLLGRRWWRFAGGLVLLAFVLALVTFEFHPHYAAPVAPLVHAFLVGGLARLWRVGGGGAPRRRAVARLLVLGVILWGTTYRLATLPREVTPPEPWDWPRHRAAIAHLLEEQPGEDLVVVSYRPEHSVFEEWVKNGADLEEEPVVWARDLGDPESRRRLLEHFGGRRAWLLLADARPPRLLPLERRAPEPVKDAGETP